MAWEAGRKRGVECDDISELLSSRPVLESLDERVISSEGVLTKKIKIIMKYQIMRLQLIYHKYIREGSL